MKKKCASNYLICLTIISIAFFSLSSCGKRGAPKAIGAIETYSQKKYPTH